MVIKPNPPRPNYEHDVDLIVREYKRALKEIRITMQDVFLDDMSRGNMLLAEEQIERIIRNLEETAVGIASELYEKAVTDGIERTLYETGLAKTLKEARGMVRFGELNQPLIEAVISDTQADMLAITQNVNRRTKQIMRQALSAGMREQYAQGGGRGQDVVRAVMRKLDKDINVAIIDAAGRKWKTETYVKMAVQTNAMNAHREAAKNTGIEEGAYYGVISSHQAKDACRHYEGMVVALAAHYATDNIPYVEDLPRSEIFHPYCKHLVIPVFNPDRYM